MRYMKTLDIFCGYLFMKRFTFMQTKETRGPGATKLSFHYRNCNSSVSWGEIIILIRCLYIPVLVICRQYIIGDFLIWHFLIWFWTNMVIHKRSLPYMVMSIYFHARFGNSYFICLSCSNKALYRLMWWDCIWPWQ